MAKFIIYTYQFSPLLTLFDSVEESEAAMKRKNEVFEELFADFNSLCLTNGRGKASRRSLPLEGVNNKQFILFHLGDPKRVPLEKIVDGKFVNTSDTTSPHCMILIDNRKDIQRIYIEKKATAFQGNTDRIARFLQLNFNHLLSKKHLSMIIRHEYSERLFWEYVTTHAKKIKSIEFFIPYPNLPRVSDNVNEGLREIATDYNSNLKLRLEAPALGRIANLDPGDERLQSFAKTNARSGVPIKIEQEGIKGFIQCGKNVYQSIELPDKMSQLTEEDFKDHLFGDNMEYIANHLGNDVRPAAQ